VHQGQYGIMMQPCSLFCLTMSIEAPSITSVLQQGLCTLVLVAGAMQHTAKQVSLRCRLALLQPGATYQCCGTARLLFV
jgi:hypothetical protein